jgi:N utilization substance protein A
MQQPRTEFAQALRAIAQERNLDAGVILETIQQAIVAAYKRDARERGEDAEELNLEAVIDSGSGEARVFLVSEDGSKKDITPPGFGRIAAQTAKQVIHQKIREAEKGAIMDEFSGKVGSLISGIVLRFDGPDVRVDLGKSEGIMPASERISTERLNLAQRLTFLLKDIVETAKGKMLILSRADEAFVKKLFEREVPEIGAGNVEIKGVAREAGVRTKITVLSHQSGIDPVGSCVGQRGVRVQAVTNELGGERVDIIPFSENAADMVEAALAPADHLSVKLDEKTKTAFVSAPSDQLSLAIGREGQNARLAAKLTGWKIEVVKDDSLAEEGTENETPLSEEKSEEQNVKQVEEDSKADKNEN